MGVETPSKFSKKGGLKGLQFLEGRCWERGGDAIFNLKSEIFNDKKCLYAKTFFSVITKNSNRGIRTKNLVSFKRKDGVKDEKLQYFEGSLKNLTFREGGVTKSGVDCLKRKGTSTVSQFKGGIGKKE